MPIERVRKAVRRAVAERTLRQVARELDLSPTGLSHFLDGSEPYAKTVRKLVAWYVRDAAGRHGVDNDTAAAALALLVDGLPLEEAEVARESILAALRAHYANVEAPPPDWLNE